MSKSAAVSVGAVLIAVLLLELIVLVVLWIVLLKRTSGKPRKLLFLPGIAAIVLALLLFGGQWMLELFELTWRQWLRSVFTLLLWSCGLTVSALIVWRIPSGISRRGRLLQGIAALALVAAMGLGTLFGGFGCTAVRNLWPSGTGQRSSGWKNTFWTISVFITNTTAPLCGAQNP